MAVRATVSTGDGVTVIQALAGTGKTYTAGVLREVYEARAMRCSAWRPRAVLRASSPSRLGCRQRTLERLLFDLEELGDGCRRDAF